MITEVFGKGMISTPNSVRRIIPREQPGFAGKLVYRAPHLARFDNLTMLHSRMAMREKLGNSACAAEALGQSATLILLEQNPGCSLEYSADTGDRAITARDRAAYF